MHAEETMLYRLGKLFEGRKKRPLSGCDAYVCVCLNSEVSQPLRPLVWLAIRTVIMDLYINV